MSAEKWVWLAKLGVSQQLIKQSVSQKTRGAGGSFTAASVAPAAHGTSPQPPRQPTQNPNPTEPKVGMPSPMMWEDCVPVRGKVPGPAEHLLCSTHGHVVDIKTKEIVAKNLEEYKRLHPVHGGQKPVPPAPAKPDPRPKLISEEKEPGASKPPMDSFVDGPGGRAVSAKSVEGEAEIFAGEAEIREDGHIVGKGFVAKAKKGDEDVELLSGEFDISEDGASGKGVVARVKKNGQTDTVGEFEFSKQKAAVVGAKREVDINQATGVLPGNVVAKGDVAVGTASLDGSVTDDGISVGAQANIAEGSVTVGTSGSKRDDGTDSDLDSEFRFGLSAGAGLAGRVHFADKDKDGNPEFGVGADFGPFSFDVKTEDPLRMAAVNTGNPLTAATLALDDRNMTKDMMQATVGVSPGEALNTTKDVLGSAKNGASEFVEGAKDTLKEKAEEAVDDIKDRLFG